MPPSPISGAVSTMRSNQRWPRCAARISTRRAGGMAERENRRRTIRQHDLAHEGFEIVIVFGEVAHMALAAVAAGRGRTGPGRASRASPRRSRAHAGRAPSRNTSRSIRCGPGRCTPSRAGRPAAASAHNAATRLPRLDRADDVIVRNGIGGDRDKLHAGMRSDAAVAARMPATILERTPARIAARFAYSRLSRVRCDRGDR